MLFLTTRPLWMSALLVVGTATIAAMTGPALIRRCVDFGRLSANNEIAGFKFATVGVIYAVMLAFSVIVVWERFNEAETDVSQEAAASATIYRLANGVGAGPSASLRESVSRYLDAVVTQEWPAMERGRASPAARRALDGVYTAVLTFSPEDRRGTALLSEMLHQTDLLTQSRRARLVMASGIVPAVIWVSLFGGAALTVGFTLFFGAENLRAQTLMTGALAALIFSGLLVIISIDHPFAGPVKVEPDALSAVLADFREAPPDVR